MGIQVACRMRWALVGLVWICSCIGPMEGIQETPAPKAAGKSALTRVHRWTTPEFTDDLSYAGLADAVQQSLSYYQRLDPEQTLRYGDDVYRVREVKAFLDRVLAILGGPSAGNDRAEALAKISRVYRGGGNRKEVLFTGYYEPALEGSRLPGIEYTVPLYRVPMDLVNVDLGRFRSDLQGSRIVGRYQQGSLVPYFSRHEIDRLGFLAGKGYEIAWLKDPVEAFFLHIQGSGRILLPDGSSIRVHYAASNGRPYRSIGEFLIQSGKVPPQEVAMQSLKAYLKAHPSERDPILDQNERYVFFEKVQEGTLGSLSVPLTAGRSLATDPALYPPGSIAFVETEVPVLGEDQRVTGWKSVKRFVLNQDTGGAIRGAGRADLFWGSGEQAGAEAGCMKKSGRLYFLAPKQE